MNPLKLPSLRTVTALLRNETSRHGEHVSLDVDSEGRWFLNNPGEGCGSEYLPGTGEPFDAVGTGRRLLAAWSDAHETKAIDTKYLENLPPGVPFSGKAKAPKMRWDMFSVDSGDCDYHDEILERLGLRMPIENNPEADDEYPHEGLDDLDAALCYLNTGGTLIKLLDQKRSEYWRLYAVKRGKTQAFSNPGDFYETND